MLGSRIVWMHAGDASGAIISGQCSDCHSTRGMGGASASNHDGFTDCAACHLGDRRREHDQGQCSECHIYAELGDAEDPEGLRV